MKLKKVDGELYVDKKTKVFFQNDIIPQEFQDKTKYDIVIIQSNRPVKAQRDTSQEELLHAKSFYRRTSRF